MKLSAVSPLIAADKMKCDSPPAGRPSILPLTSLRFFAAFYVVLFHTSSAVSPVLASLPWATAVISLAFVSVGFFFVLSGFILAVVYLRGNRPINALRFWTARFARVYPLFLFTLLLDAPNRFVFLMHRVGFINATRIVAKLLIGNCLMLQAWYLTFRGIDNPNWSLSVESFLYLLFPFIGKFLWHCPKRTVVSLVTVLYFATLLAAFWASKEFSLDAVKFNPLLHLAEFSGGIVAARIYMSFLTNGRRKQRLAQLSPVAVALCASIFALVVVLRNQISFAVLHDGLLTPLFMLLIIAFAGSGPTIQRIGSFAPLVLLGEASFSLYLVHIPIWHVLDRMHLTNEMPLPVYLAYLASTLFASIACFKYLEMPAKRTILAKLNTSSTEGVVAGALAQ